MARSHKSSTNHPPAADQSQCDCPADDAVDDGVDGVFDLLGALGPQLPSRRTSDGAYNPGTTTAHHAPVPAPILAAAPDLVGALWLPDACPKPDHAPARGLTPGDATRVAAAATAAYAASVD